MKILTIYLCNVQLYYVCYLLEALELVVTAASHSNEAMRKMVIKVFCYIDFAYCFSVRSNYLTDS